MSDIKRKRSAKAAGSIPQDEHMDEALAKKCVTELLMPGTVIPVATDISTAAVEVGKGNICRIRVTAQTYVAFGSSTLAAVTVNTSPAIELFAAGTYLVVARDKYIRASANVARLEILPG